MKREVTTQEALTELASAKMKLESMQQLFVLKEQLLSSKDDQINFQIFTIKEKDEEIKKLQEESKEKDLKNLGLEERLQTQLAYRFGSHSEKSFEQLSLFDDLDEDFPEAEMLTQDELKEVIEEENIVVKAYKRRKCGRKKLADNLERVPMYHDIPEEEKTYGCGAKLVKIGERIHRKTQYHSRKNLC